MRIDGRKMRTEGDRLPWGYGVAWWHGYMDQVVCYPIPFNYLIGRLRQAYFAIARGVKPSKLEAALLAAARWNGTADRWRRTADNWEREAREQAEQVQTAQQQLELYERQLRTAGLLRP